MYTFLFIFFFKRYDYTDFLFDLKCPLAIFTPLERLTFENLAFSILPQTCFGSLPLGVPMIVRPVLDSAPLCVCLPTIHETPVGQPSPPPEH